MKNKSKNSNFVWNGYRDWKFESHSIDDFKKDTNTKRLHVILANKIYPKKQYYESEEEMMSESLYTYESLSPEEKKIYNSIK
tara:strand:- start:2586 stop:2831 length:246 start_codon:yes stop_codon:yes gene_type:complete